MASTLPNSNFEPPAVARRSSGSGSSGNLFSRCKAAVFVPLTNCWSAYFCSQTTRMLTIEICLHKQPSTTARNTRKPRQVKVSQSMKLAALEGPRTPNRISANNSAESRRSEKKNFGTLPFVGRRLLSNYFDIRLGTATKLPLCVSAVALQKFIK